MKRFQFRFSAILKQRQAKEEQALRALGEAQRAYQAELQAKARLLRDLQQSLERREQLGRNEISILAIQLEQNYIDGTKQRMVRADQAIVRASRSVEKALRAYLQARRQTRMMETLYEKHYQEFKRVRAKKEQRELDEIAVMRGHPAGPDEQEEIA